LSGAKSEIVTSLTGIQIEGRPGETVVILSGNGSFRDYFFNKVSESRFILDLGDITQVGNLPMLPPPSHGLELAYADPSTTSVQIKGLRLSGIMSMPIDTYVLNTLGNNLSLTLRTLSATPPLATGPASVVSPEPPMTVSRQKLSEGRSAASSRDDDTEPAPRVVRKKRAVPDGQGTEATLKKEYKGKPISLDLLDADLRNVLRLIADVTGTNIVIEPDVTGKVTLKVEQVPWDQVLDMVLSMNGLGMQQSGNVIRVARMTRLREEVTEQAKDFEEKQKLLDVVKDFGDITTEYLTVNYAQPAEIRDKIKEVMSDKGRISIDERTNLIIYSDYPARISTARRLIARLDRATPQVMIEARIVTMGEDTTKELGIRWNLNFNDKDQPVKEYEVDLRSTAAGTALGWNFAQILGSTITKLDFNLAALETQNRSKIIAAPKVLTLNNVKATISQGNQIPYLEQSASDAGVVSTVFKDAIVELQVTPHITPDGKIRLEIEAKQDEPNPTLSGQQDQPAISTRKIKTELLVADGCIVVIGGVMRDTQGYTLDTTPGMKDIPLLGRLFKSESKVRTKEELLIFISPKIVEL
jgi:type IV pilus assembly protein PilQ